MIRSLFGGQSTATATPASGEITVLYVHTFVQVTTKDMTCQYFNSLSYVPRSIFLCEGPKMGDWPS